MPLTAPNWRPAAIATPLGWAHEVTGEQLVSRKDLAIAAGTEGYRPNNPAWMREYNEGSGGGDFTFSVGRYTDTLLIDCYIVGDPEFVQEGSTIDWGDGNIVTLTSNYLELIHEYPDDGSYTISVTEVGTGRTGTYALNVATAEDLGPSPFGPSAEISSAVAFANETVIQFYDISLVNEAPTAWLWDFGDGSTSTLQNPTHIFTTAGAKTVTLALDGGTPETVATVNVFAEVTWTATPEFADDFTGDGQMASRVPTTPMVSVFDEWASLFPTAVTAGGKYVNEDTSNGAPVEIGQWLFGDVGQVTPPAELMDWELSFDWANNTAPGGEHDSLEVNMFSVIDGSDQIQLAKLSWNPWQNGRWSFNLAAYPNTTFAQSIIIIPQPAADVPVNIRVAFKDGKQYLFVGDQVAISEAADTPRPMNKISMQLGRKDATDGTDKIDNLVLSSLT